MKREMIRRVRVWQWAPGVLAVLAAVSAAAQSPDSLPIFELRRARFSPMTGYQLLAFAYPDHLPEAMRAPPYSLGVYVSDHPLLTDRDFAMLREVSPGPSDLHLIVEWSGEGAARMARDVRVGEQVAWLVEGRLLGVARLASHLAPGVPQFISLRMPGEAAARVAARLSGRSPP